MYASGPDYGGKTEVITGTNFASGDIVKFGTTPAATVTVNSPTQITVTDPPHSPGTVDVTVTDSSDQTSAITSADQFTYLAAPTVTSISPGSGPAAGGTPVTIHGTNFSNATEVFFGLSQGIFSSGFTVVNDNEITTTAPPGTGTVDVTVQAANGTVSEVNPNDQFTYLAAPTATALTTAVTSFGSLRNNGNETDGAVIQVGSANLTVTALGRMMVSGNAQTHTLELVDASTNQILGSVSLSMSGGVAGQFKYASLSSPVTLLAGHKYYLASKETSGGDQWYNEPTAVRTTSAASVTGGVWSISPGSWFPDALPGLEYVGVDLQYQLVPPAPPTRLIVTAGNAQVALNWSASSGASSYNIYRSTSSGGEGSTPYQTGVTITSFTDTNLTNGTTYYYEVTAVNAGGESARSSEVSATPAASTSTALTTAVTSFGPLRNNSNETDGAVIQVGSANLTVTALGRIMVSGNSQTHLVELVDASTNQVLGSVSLAMSGGVAGQFKYASLSSPVTLLAGHKYYLVSKEFSGGDQWYNEPTTVRTTSAASVIGGVWSLSPGSWFPDTLPGQEYVGVDLQYATP